MTWACRAAWAAILLASLRFGMALGWAIIAAWRGV